MTYIRALFILQFHLLRNALTRGKLLAYFIVSFIATGAVLFACVLGWLFFTLSSQWLPEQPPSIVLLAFNVLLLVYCVGWFWGLVMEVQRSDIIDVRKMLHFPVPFSIVNGINFAVSLVGFTSLFYFCGATGLLLGIKQATGHGLIKGILAASVFFFLASAWAYYVRGLLVVWMENKRRRRLLLTVLPFFFMAVGFTPMMLNNIFMDHQSSEDLAAWLSAPEQLAWVEFSSFLHPGGLLSLALTAIFTGAGYFWIPVAILLCLASLGYWLGYRTTLRYSVGNQSSASAKATQKRTSRTPWTAREWPFFHPETAALAQALFLNFIRHPQIRTMLLAPFALIILLAVMKTRTAVFGQGGALPMMAIIWPFFTFGSIFFNLFGMDKQGFRTLLLLPTPRHRILLAYHLALLPMAGGMGMLFALGGIWYFSMDLGTIVVSFLQVMQLFLSFCLLGSFLSIYAPMAIGRNMMRKQQSRALLMAFVMPVAVALLVLPTGLCFMVDGFASRWGFVDYSVAPLLSLAFLTLTLIAYPFLLKQAGDLLLLREQRILATLLKTAE